MKLRRVWERALASGGPRRTHAVRVAVTATLVVAAAAVALAVALDLFVNVRLTQQADVRLHQALRDVAAGGVPLQSSGPDDEIDNSPVFVWRVGPSGRSQADPRNQVRTLPTLPPHRWSSGPVNLSLHGRTFRFAAQRSGKGWLVAGVSLADITRIEELLIKAELLAGSALVVLTFVGALVVGLTASAPVEEARRRQLEFTADASHELRTPLSVIEAEVELALSRQRSPESYMATLSRVQDEGRRLRRIIEDLLWLARMDTAPGTPASAAERTPLSTDLRSAASQAVDRFAGVARARQLDLHLDDGSQSAVMDAPSEWIDRLLGVLVDNACRYTPPGGSVVVSAGPRPGRRVGVRVSDTGPGIPAEQRERIFDRFHRGTHEPGGVGLGLAIADSVVRHTGGSWQIGEGERGGTAMEVVWPRGAHQPPGGEGRIVDNRKDSAPAGRIAPAEPVSGTVGARSGDAG